MRPEGLPVRWIVDTSAWARRDKPAVRDQIKSILEESDESRLVLAPTVMLELLRGPQGDAVAAERSRLLDHMELLAADTETFALAADAMERMAEWAPEGHRIATADLLTAALAHQHRCGVIHIDRDFLELAERSGLTFEERMLAAPGEGQGNETARGQRQLRAELSQLLHRMPVASAEAFLTDTVDRARAAIDG
jgi:predicted nucleic acid-binding protein